MINNLEEKKYAEEQILKLENILLDFKQKLLPDREEQYLIMASYYVKKIREIREEIEEYTGMEAFSIIKSDVNIHIEGPTIDYGSAPISVVSTYLSNFRKTIQNIYAINNDINYRKKLPKFITDICDFRLNALTPGSINLSLSLPPIQCSLFDCIDIEKSVETYFNILKWTYYEDESYLENINSNILDSLLSNVIRTLPDEKNISRITFSGDIINNKEKLIINNKSRKIIKDSISKKNSDMEKVNIIGRLRELDLDKQTFILRDINDVNNTEVKCRITDDIVEDLKEYFDSIVSITGFKKDNLITVKFIEEYDNNIK